MPNEFEPSRIGQYVVPIDEQWTLSDLAEFPHVHEQVYAFIAAFRIGEISATLRREDDAYLDSRVLHAFRAYPWWGGYSAVNFYNSLRSGLPRPVRPVIRSIQYSSPGWIELSLVVTIALNIKAIVGHLVSAGDQINRLYGRIQKGIDDRKLRRIEIRKKELALAREHLEFCTDATQELANDMGFKDVSDLHRMTSNSLAALLIFLSFYRRMRELSKFVESGKANLLESGSTKERR